MPFRPDAVPLHPASGAAAVEAEPLGLRARKKAQTRAHVSDTATELFLERGFDEVTLAEVAAAADVSVKTIFNYFGGKEDLLFDREEEWQSAIDLMALLRPAGLGVITMLRDDVQVRWPALDYGRWSELTTAAVAGRSRFFTMIHEHPALHGRTLQMGERLRLRVTALVAAELDVEPDDAVAESAGSLVWAAYTAVGSAYTRGLLNRDQPTAIIARCQTVGEEAFSRLELAYAGTPLVGRPPN